MTFRSLTWAALVAFLVAGCMATDSLAGRTNLATGTLGPLSLDKVALVQITQEEAARTVLAHEQDTGWPDPDIAWQDAGCVRIAWFEPHPMSFNPDPGPAYPVYLVRLVDPAAAGNTLWVMVDAQTGAIRSAFGAPLDAGCAGPGVE
jgi:hypothetical protein